MLLQFNFKNFKSFKDETCLDFTATKIKEYSDHIMKSGDQNVLPIAAIFGANASGKTGIIEAFRFMQLFVLNSLNNIGTSNRKLISIPFLFDSKTQNEESLFEIYFNFSDDPKAKEYCYGFTVNKSEVIEEWLNVKSKTSIESRMIFYRNKGIIEYNNTLKEYKKNIEISLENETLLLTLGSKLKITILKKISDWFLNVRFADYCTPLEDLSLSQRAPRNFDNDKSVRKEVVDFISTFDDSIVDFEIIKNGYSNNQLFNINSIHKINDTGNFVSLPFQMESAGTLKMFSLFSLIKDTLDFGGILVIDELNSKLHPLLVRKVLQYFFDKKYNKNNSQIIFTTHDSWQLDSKVLRRDEIWFTEKNNQESILYSLSDFLGENGEKIRNDENFEKNYLLGKYGAIPNLKDLDFYGDN